MTNQRYSTAIESIAVGTTAPNSDVIDYGNFTAGQVFCPTGSLIAIITWYSCATKDGTYLQCSDGAASPAAITSDVFAGLAQQIPDALKGCKYLKAVASTGSAGTIDITLKD